jgi:hypothetical protein
MEKKVKPVRVDSFDIEDLAIFILGLDENSESCEIELALYEEFECTLESFSQIIAHLLPLCDVGESPLTKKVYRGFSDRKNQRWIIKTENQQQL